MINGTISIDWADGRHQFNVAIFEHAFELEEKCAAGLLEIFERVSSRKWRVADLFETIRIGLIGGGLPPAKALKLVRKYVEGRPWAESVPVAQAILVAALVGVPEDNDLGKLSMRLPMRSTYHKKLPADSFKTLTKSLGLLRERRVKRILTRKLLLT